MQNNKYFPVHDLPCSLLAKVSSVIDSENKSVKFNLGELQAYTTMLRQYDSGHFKAFIQHPSYKKVLDYLLGKSEDIEDLDFENLCDLIVQFIDQHQ